MLRWNWDVVLGELVCESKRRTEDGIESFEYAKRIYQGNCLGVIGVLEKGSEEDEGTWTVYSEYWLDKEHLESCLDGDCYFYVKKVRLNSDYWDQKMMTIFTCFRKRGITVEVYSEKKEKGKGE